MVFLSVSRMILMCFSSKTIKNVRFRAVSTNRTYHYIYIYIYCQGVLGKIHKIFQIFFKSKKNDVIFTKNAQNSFVFICFCLYFFGMTRNERKRTKFIHLQRKHIIFDDDGEFWPHFVGMCATRTEWSIFALFSSRNIPRSLSVSCADRSAVYFDFI